MTILIINVLVSDKLILNPAKITTKGLTNARIKSNLEKRKRKTTKGTILFYFI